ncbi:autism susceptibility gene 2 protein homolog isoform X2 [Acipenser ruthenus]|uniref:autism susceptibility gene 2 protein homolog isoform X2 n=1 Tax=Acipenser ruthenus TaxID=7906 RepID=UPI0027422430|nr:autism susceptibility gene 2 protein homolog isoform X2 [Acipenser ruthenus]
MEGPCRSSGSRQSRRSRSQRDRERRRRRSCLGETRAYSPSSGSEREEAAGPGVGPGGGRLDGGDNRPAAHNNRPRPPRRRKKNSVSCEEDFIDGFAIASFISLEALEDVALKPQERALVWERRIGKRKRPEEPGLASEPEERREGESSEWERAKVGEPGRRAKRKRRRRRRRRGGEGSGHAFLETGYVCDTESDSDDRACDGDLDQPFTVSTSTGPESAVNGPTPLSLAPRLSVTPKISGIQRSQERNQEPDGAPYLPTEPPNLLPGRLHPPSSSLTKEARRGDRPAPLLLEPLCNYHGGHKHARTTLNPQSNPSPGNRSTPQPKPHGKGLLHPFGSAAPAQAVYGTGLGFNSRCSTPSKTPTSSSSSSSSQLSLHRPSTPSSLALALNPSFPGGLRPPSHPGGRPFTPSPGLPPPPPLLQAAGHPASGAAATAAFSEQDLIRQELNSRFLTSQSRGGGGADRAGGGAGGEGRGPSASTAPTGSGTASGPASIGPLAFQFHQHNHQHQHTHTHQHYTPFLPPSAAATAVVPNTPAAPMFDKYPGKMDGLYQHSFYPAYPPSVSGLPPVLPPAGTFSSLQGAFQPKTTNPDIAARLGAVPHPLQSKDPRLTDPFRAALRVSNKPGKWCAMHVRVAWMILRHQEKVKHMQADPHKPDFPSDLLTRVPGSGSVGPLSGAHDLSRPSTLFSAGGAVHPGSSPFAPPTGPPNPFLTPPSHLDHYRRSPSYTPLGALSNAAFGGLGSPNIAPSLMFSHKEGPGGSQGFSHPHDPYNRLHRAPPSFPTAPAWPKGGDGERGASSSSSSLDREREREKRVIKDEKERDGVYSRHPIRMSPVTPNQKCSPLASSSTASHSNGHAVPREEKRGGGRDSREHSRDRDKERGRPSVLSLHRDRDRPKSLSSDVAARDSSSSSSFSEQHKIKEQQAVNSLQNNDNSHPSLPAQHRPPRSDPSTASSGQGTPAYSSNPSAAAAPSLSKSLPDKDNPGREGGHKPSSAASPLAVRENGGPPTPVGSAGEKKREKERERDRDRKPTPDQLLSSRKSESCPASSTTPPPPPPPPPSSLLPVPLVKVKEERKEEPPEPIPIPIPPSHPHPPAPTPPCATPLTFDRPSSRGGHLSSQQHPSLHPLANQVTSSGPKPASLAAAMALKFSPAIAQHHHPAASPSSSSSSSSSTSHPLSSLSVLERSRALGAAYLGGHVLAHPSIHHHPHSPASFWNLQEVLQQQQQQQQQLVHQRREMALNDPQIARFFTVAAQHRLYEQERVGYVREEFGGHPHSLAPHPHPHHPHHPLLPLHHDRAAGRAAGSPSSSAAMLGAAALLEGNERAQILREDFERARFYGMAALEPRPHPHHPHPLLAAPQLSAATSLFSRLCPETLYSPHHPHQSNGFLSKTPSSIVGPPPPLIPSGAAAGPLRSSVGSPRDGSRCTPLQGTDHAAIYSSHKGRDSR